MKVDPNEIRLSKAWQRNALFTFGLTYSVGLLPMLFWPQSALARGFCIATGLVGMIALASLVVAVVGSMLAMVSAARTRR